MTKLESWLCRVVASGILLVAVYQKFVAAEETVALFRELGMEPHGRILIGVLELLAVILLLNPHSIPYGAILGLGVMTGALLGHLTQLGVTGAMLPQTGLAVIVWVCCLGLLILHRRQAPFLKNLCEE